ncbi:integrase [Ochrobactrum sp. 19YEA23]|uniref:integrase n=1 Tax=Ochrobactrum sp. 19YEA23 TaxID=3039854 RepID=UPI002479593E|nr:integrase [Ochrobactrum sp. 19YEA23]
MAGKIRYLLNRDGRYFARLTVPPDLREYLQGDDKGKRELREPLGGDRRIALKLLPGVVADIQARIGIAEANRARATATAFNAMRYPMSIEGIAQRHYQKLLTLDDQLRMSDPRFASIGFDDVWIENLRDGIAGRLNDDQLDKLIGGHIERYRVSGNTDVKKGSEEWRKLAMAICIAEYEGESRSAERNEGVFNGEPEHPMLVKAIAAEEEKQPDIAVRTFSQIIDDEVKRRSRGKDAKPISERSVKKYRDNCKEFAKHRKSDNAATVTAIEGKRWIESMQDAGENGNRTVKAKFQNVVTVLNWERKRDLENFFPLSNPLSAVQKPNFDADPSYLSAYTLDEAKLVLKAARKEELPMFRWIPWLCAYSGMRISEAGRLEKGDFFKSGDRWFYKVTKVGGRSLKNSSSERRIPVHTALIDEGFIKFMEASPEGRLFRGKTKDIIDPQPRVSEWIRKLIPMSIHPELMPNHGWRHLFEDFCRRDRVQEEARFYMVGRTSGGSHEAYGRSEVMLPGLAAQMDQIQPIDLDNKN